MVFNWSWIKRRHWLVFIKIFFVFEKICVNYEYFVMLKYQNYFCNVMLLWFKFPYCNNLIFIFTMQMISLLHSFKCWGTYISVFLVFFFLSFFYFSHLLLSSYSFSIFPLGFRISLKLYKIRFWSLVLVFFKNFYQFSCVILNCWVSTYTFTK